MAGLRSCSAPHSALPASTLRTLEPTTLSSIPTPLIPPPIMSPSVDRTQSASSRPPFEPGPYPKVPFPEDTPAHPLLVIDFQKVEAGAEAEIDTLFKACSTLGFFYLKVSNASRMQVELNKAVWLTMAVGVRGRTLGSKTWSSQCSR